jgi:ATPase subunit of ABC transporter with duplicated ATPase domains
MSKTNSNSLQELSYEEMRYIHEKKNTWKENFIKERDGKSFYQVINDKDFLSSLFNHLSISEQPFQEEVQGKQKQEQKQEREQEQEQKQKQEQKHEQKQEQKIEKIEEVQVEQERTESQAHGFKFEDSLKEQVFKIDTKIKYTSKYDIPKEFNIINNHNISIKTTGNRDIGCADIFRFLENDETEMIITCYKQDGDYKIVKETYSIQLTEDFMKSLNDDINKDKLNQLNQLIKNIPHGKVSEETKKEYKNKCKQLSLEYFIVNPKVDSKKQRRVQCTLKLDAILNRKDIKYEIFNGAEYYGKKYIGKFFSPRRKRNKK